MRKVIMAAVVGAALATSPVMAQQQSGLVNVAVGDITVRDVLRDILNDNTVQVGALVQAPVGIAANVCNVSAAVLAQQAADAAPCQATAESATRGELTQLARRMQRQ
jgi:hypothetical protein